MLFFETSVDYNLIFSNNENIDMYTRHIKRIYSEMLTVGIPGFTGGLYFLYSFLGLRFSGMHLYSFYNQKKVKFRLLRNVIALSAL